MLVEFIWQMREYVKIIIFLLFFLYFHKIDTFLEILVVAWEVEVVFELSLKFLKKGFFEIVFDESFISIIFPAEYPIHLLYIYMLEIYYNNTHLYF